MSADWFFVFELVDQCLLCVVRCMHAVVWQIEEKGFVLVATDEIHRFVGQEIGQIFIFPMFDGRSRVLNVMISTALNIFKEPTVGGVLRVGGCPIPFYEHPGRVSGLLECLGNCHFIERQLRDVINRLEGAALPIEAVN